MYLTEDRPTKYIGLFIDSLSMMILYVSFVAVAVNIIIPVFLGKILQTIPNLGYKKQAMQAEMVCHPKLSCIMASQENMWTKK